jgi:hypothetical protein
MFAVLLAQSTKDGAASFGLAVMLGVGAIVVGYLVYCIVPANHFPRTAGLLTANLVLGVLAG